MKILYITTIGSTMSFFESFLRELISEGHTVDIATNEDDKPLAPCYRELGCKVYRLSCSRSPLKVGNLKAIREIRRIVTENAYDIVHCHTPIAAACTRLACRKVRKQGTRVFYTAHGFHFFKGAPKKNWLIYYPIEKLCAHFTDVLITINHEDYALAQKKLKAKRVTYVPGVGIDLEKFGKGSVDKAAKRQELGVPEDATVFLSVGELNANKNHETVMRAIADREIYYLIAGRGELREHLQRTADALGMTDRVKLLGFRSDIDELCAAADAFVFPSFREGLSVSVMEAMASGLPVVCSRIRGNTDLIDENGGVLFDPHSVEELKNAIRILTEQDGERLGAYNRERIRDFAIGSVNETMLKLYADLR